MKKLIPFIIIALIIIGVFLIIDSFKEASEEKSLMEASVQSFVEVKDVDEVKDTEYFNDEHEHDHSVEIEGSEIKRLTIQQIADLWQIDSKELLNRIIQEFDFQENYTTETILEDMRNEYKFSPAIIKDIAEEIKE